MPRFLFFYFLFLIHYSLFSQNIGIGTTSPQTRLHINSSTSEALRLEANQPFLSLYHNSVYSGYFWRSPNSIELGSAAGSNLPVTLAPDGIQRFFVTPSGNVGIGTSSPQNKLHVQGQSLFNGYVGIENPNPTSPLEFAAAIGEKISFYTFSGTQKYGFGVQNGLLQIYAATATDHIAFGTGSSDFFTEAMRIKGNGAIAFNGSEGMAGQYLKSNGPNSSPTWVSPPLPFANTTLVNGPFVYHITNTDPGIAIPGFSYTFSCADSSKVLVLLNYRVFINTPCTGGVSQPHIELMFDNVQSMQFDYDIHRVAVNQHFTGSHLIYAGPGTHTIEIRAFRYGCDIQLTGGGFGTNMIVQVMPK